MKRAIQPYGRRGFSLVEMMVVITLMTLVAGVALTMLRSLLLAERQAQRAGPRRVAVAELRDDLRADLRRAQSVQLEQEVLDVRRADGPVHYELADGQCRRGAGDAPPRAYRVGEVARWRLERDGSIATVVLEREPDAAGGPIHVAAALGAALPERILPENMGAP